MTIEPKIDHQGEAERDPLKDARDQAAAAAATGARQEREKEKQTPVKDEKIY